MTALVIVESPAKGGTIKKYLGDNFAVKASYGHVMDLPTEKSLGVSLDRDFQLQYQVLPGKEDKIQALESAAVRAEQIYLATDPDREGEVIAWNLFQKLYPLNPNIKRVTFKEITKKEILKEIARPREIDANLVAAQQARRAIDRIVGYLVSDFLRSQVGGGLSAGRVQSPAIKVVVDREKEIENFIPEDYWNIAVLLETAAKEKFLARLFKEKVSSAERAEDLRSQLNKSTFSISDIEKVEKVRRPQPPLTTSALTSLAATKLKFKADRTMAAAQKLYESGLITYMRTDSCRISPEALEECRAYLREAGHLPPPSPNLYVTEGAQDAHEAIRPTVASKSPSSIIVSEDEWKVYKLIWTRFIASQMLPAIFDVTNITVAASNGSFFRCTGKILKQKGWLEMLSSEMEDDDTLLPALESGQNLTLQQVKVEKKSTQPPSRFTIATLIDELKKLNIGRPSTIATIMTKITEKSYVSLEKNMVLKPTLEGKNLVSQIEKYFDFIRLKFTSDLEEKLDQIAEGKCDYLSTMREFYNGFSPQLKQAYLSQHPDSGFRCPDCQEPLFLKKSRKGENYLACFNYPHSCKYSQSCEVKDNKINIVKRYFQVVQPTEGISCPKCQGPMRESTGKFGPYYLCLDEVCRGTRSKLAGKKCPKCSAELILRVYQGESLRVCQNNLSCSFQEKTETPLIVVPKVKLGDRRKFFKQR